MTHFPNTSGNLKPKPHDKTIPTTKNAHHKTNGGGGRNRTDDLLRAKQALSQLSYAPKSQTTTKYGGPGKT